MVDAERPIVCSLHGDYRGFCCLTLQNHTTELYLHNLKKEVKRAIRETRWSQPLDVETIREEPNFHFRQISVRPSRALENNDASFDHSFSSSGLLPSDLEHQNLGLQHAKER